MFATNKRFSVKSGRLITGANSPLQRPEVAVSPPRQSPYSASHNKGGKEQASLFGASFGMGAPGAANGMSVLGSGPMSTNTMLSGLVPENETLLNIYYRDIYYYDAVAGAAVDIISTFPFSDYSLMGIEDTKVLDKYEESVYRLNIRALMPQISTCYLVDGKFVGTMVFNQQEKLFYDMIVHSADTCVVDDLPLFSTDPVVTVTNNQLLMNFMNSNDPQAQMMRKALNPKLAQALRSSRFKLDPLSTLYIARRTLPNSEPTSFLKRVLPIYLIEKTLYRGTLVEAARRQRAMLHITMGDDTWEPTPQEMMASVLQFQQADLDPLGAVVATRNGVQVAEVRQGGDFWKWTDSADLLTPIKLRALGISEAFLSGDSNFSNVESAMSVFMENMDAYRSFITHKTFDTKIFPIIAVTNGFYKDASKAPATNQGRAQLLYKANNQNDLMVPTLRWHKTLKAKDEADQFAALDYMAEKGIPVPLRMIFAAAKVDPNDLYQDLQQDKRMKERLAQAAGVDPKEIAPGGDAGGDNVGGEFASLQRMTSSKKIPLLARNFGEHGEIQAETKTGKPKYVHNQREANRQINANIVKAAAKLAADPTLQSKVAALVAKRLGRVPDMGLVPGRRNK